MNEKKKLWHLPTVFLVLVAFYMAGSVFQNILATKTFGTPEIAITTGGTIISWLVFLCMDVITEIWGKKKAILCFWISAGLNLLFSGIAWICIATQGNNDFLASSYEVILGTGWRIVVASISAFLIGNYANTYIMYWMRKKSKNPAKTAGFMLRAVLSTLAGQLLDNGVFYLIAFAPLGIAGTIEQSWITILQLVGFTTLIETIVEGLVSPLTAQLVKKLKKEKEEQHIETDVELGKE